MQEYIWLLWDIMAAFIIFWCVRVCARQGLVRTIVGFLAYFIATLAARYLSPLASVYLYDYFVKDAIVLFVDNRMGETIASGQDFAVRLVESFPKLLRQFLPFPSQLAQDAYMAMNTKEMIEAIIEAAVREPVLLLLQSLCFIVFFSAALFFARHLSRLFGGIYRIPLIGSVNTLLGGIVGLFQAVIFMLIGAFLLNLCIFITEDNIPWLNSNIMDNTFIWRVFYKIVLK